MDRGISYCDVFLSQRLSSAIRQLSDKFILVRFPMYCFSGINISQGSVTTCLRSAGIFNDGLFQISWRVCR